METLFGTRGKWPAKAFITFLRQIPVEEFCWSLHFLSKLALKHLRFVTFFTEWRRKILRISCARFSASSTHLKMIGTMDHTSNPSNEKERRGVNIAALTYALGQFAHSKFAHKIFQIGPP